MTTFLGLLFILSFYPTSSGSNSVVTTSASETTFVSLGDWGAASLGGYHYDNTINTFNAIQTYASANNPQFVLNTGDNFYYCGIQNTSDAQINEDYVSVFGKLSLPWYNILGNHDYGFNPEAQLELPNVISQWIMDDRYYYRRIELSSPIVIHLIALDTNPCITDYRGTNKYKWDPCGTEYPNCDPQPGACYFHENIVAVECAPQLKWLTALLDTLEHAKSNSKTEWVIVMGHHRADEINVDDFQTQLSRKVVDLYMNGHVHDLEHYAVNGDAKYMTTGAASMVFRAGYAAHTEKHDNKHYQYSDRLRTNTRNIWVKVVTGYSTHTISGNGTTLTTEFRDAHNTVVYSFQLAHK